MDNKVHILDGERFILTFEDNFEGDSLDKTKWELCPQVERQDAGGFWDDSMIEVHDGKLFCKVDVNKFPEGQDYNHEKYPLGVLPISGGIRTRGIFEQAYGWFEARCKLMRVTGPWDAFWMMCGRVAPSDKASENGVEIDIMESVYNENFIGHTLHWDGYGPRHKAVGQHFHTRDDLFDDDFHTFALKWSPKSYAFYIDGKKTYETTAAGVCKFPGYMKLTCEFGAWGGKITPENYPAAMEVDYVRAYQFEELFK